MTFADATRFLAVLVSAGVATTLLARLAPRWGWTDAPRGRDAARKLQRRAVPAVGGAALCLALAWAPAAMLGWTDLGGNAADFFGQTTPASAWKLATLAALFAVGSWDDRVGLRPGQKAAAQLAALAPFALGLGLASGWSAAPVALLAGFVALNLLNTFDNADGALAALASVGFACVVSPIAAATLGFLPFNLDAGRACNRASGAPSAYLGDAGAYVLAYLVLVTPAAGGLLVLPGLDLARLSLVRLWAGSRPWIGDRRHLSHRLQARGLTPVAVAVALVLIALPACALLPAALGALDLGRAALGVGATALLFVAALVLTRAPEAP